MRKNLLPSPILIREERKWLPAGLGHTSVYVQELHIR